MDLSGSRFTRLRDAVTKFLGRPDSEAALRDILAQPDRQPGFLERLTEQLMVGESFFFRNEYHFRVLREQVLPQILSENAARRELRVWSAGCATAKSRTQ